MDGRSKSFAFVWFRSCKSARFNSLFVKFQPPESFVDTRRLPIIKKRVRRIEEQAENESRKIWKEVTLGLKLVLPNKYSTFTVVQAGLGQLIGFFSPSSPRYNNVDQATNAKINIEQKQRDEAQVRKEKNEKWEPRVSHLQYNLFWNSYSLLFPIFIRKKKSAIVIFDKSVGSSVLAKKSYFYVFVFLDQRPTTTGEPV